MLTVKEVAWLAGLLEGEGCFQDNQGSPKVDLQTTDQDVIVEAARIMCSTVCAMPRRPKGKASYKPVWRTNLHGTKAVGLMMTIYTLMGERRKAKIKEILDKWRASPRAPRAPRGQRFMATCHPDRVRCGHGLCDTCYMQQWRAKRREAAQLAAA